MLKKTGRRVRAGHNPYESVSRGSSMILALCSMIIGHLGPLFAAYSWQISNCSRSERATTSVSLLLSRCSMILGKNFVKMVGDELSHSHTTAHSCAHCSMIFRQLDLLFTVLHVQISYYREAKCLQIHGVSALWAAVVWYLKKHI